MKQKILQKFINKMNKVTKTNILNKKKCNIKIINENKTATKKHTKLNNHCVCVCVCACAGVRQIWGSLAYINETK